MAHLGDRVAAFVDGQLSADEDAAARTHLSRCRDCRGAVDAQYLLKHRMTGLHPAPQPSRSLLSTLADPERLPRRRERSRLRRLWRRPGARALAALTGASLTVTAVAYVVGSPAPEDEEVASPAVDQFVARFVAASTVALKPTNATVRAAPGGVYRLASVEQRIPTSSDSARAVQMLQRAADPTQTVSLALLKKNYELSVASSAWINGRLADEVVAARDGRVVASYWIARVGGTLLRSIAYDQSGSAVTQTDATSVAPGDDQPVSTQIPTTSLASLRRSGWACDDRLGRNFERVDSSWLRDRGEQIIALTYTDGVSTLALYEQDGTLEPDRLRGFRPRHVARSTVWIRSGDPTVAAWSDDGALYTIVTDAPQEQLVGAIADLPRAEQDPLPAERVRAGVRRITTWVTPTH